MEIIDDTYIGINCYSINPSDDIFKLILEQRKNNPYLISSLGNLGSILYPPILINGESILAHIFLKFFMDFRLLKSYLESSSLGK